MGGDQVRQRTRMRDRRVMLACVAASVALIAACGATPASQDESAAPGAAADGFPVEITNCGVTTIYERPPERVVTLAGNTTELLLALGLANRIVGIVGTPSEENLLPEYLDEARGLPIVAESAFPYPSREVVLAAEPDLLVSGFGGDFVEDAYGTRESWAADEIDIFSMSQTCDEEADQTIGGVYGDIVVLGRIFDVEAKATALVDSIRSQISSVRDSLAAASVEPVAAFHYDSGEDIPITTQNGLLGEFIIEAAGGENIFTDLGPFAEVS